jgi:hypothetical protein
VVNCDLGKLAFVNIFEIPYKKKFFKVMKACGENEFLSHSNFINLYKKSSYKVVQLLLKSSQEVVDYIFENVIRE